MAPREPRVTAAVRHDQVRPMTPATLRGHEVAALDGPTSRAQIANPQAVEGLEHGLGDGATLCGIPQSELMVMRHLFAPAGPSACSACTAALSVDGDR
jgi:hypothetical protein